MKLNIFTNESRRLIHGLPPNSGCSADSRYCDFIFQFMKYADETAEYIGSNKLYQVKN